MILLPLFALLAGGLCVFIFGLLIGVLIATARFKSGPPGGSAPWDGHDLGIPWWVP